MSGGKIKDFDEITSFLGDYGLFQFLQQICAVSHRFGRKPVFFATLVLQTVTSLIQATSVNWVMFSVLNCLRGLGQISNHLVLLILGSETLGPSARVSFTVLGHSLGYGIGYALLPLFAYFIRGWRMLPVATALPCFLFIPTWRVLPESPRWLLRKGRVEEAEIIIRNAAKRNRVHAPEVIFRAGECLELKPNKDEDEPTYTYVDLIRTPNMRLTMILCVFIWMACVMVFYGLSLNTSNLSGNVYLTSFISAAIDIVVYVATWLLINRAPRSTLIFCTLVFCGITLLIIQLVPEDMHVMFQVLAIMGKIGVSGGFSLVGVYFTELFLTVVRNMGFGMMSTPGHIGTIIGPYVLYMGVHSKILPDIVFGTITIIAGALSILLPETRNRKLPDLISEAKPIRGCCCLKKTAAAQSDTIEGCEEMSKSALC